MLGMALPVLTAFGEAVLTKLFVGTVSDTMKKSWVSIRADEAKHRAVFVLIESLEPFFQAELSEPDTMLVVHALEARFRDITITPSWLATHRFDPDSMMREIEQKELKRRYVVPEELRTLLHSLTHQTLTVAIETAQVIPEWERHAWRLNFEAFEKLQERIGKNAELIVKLIEGSEVALESFEGEYCRHVIAQCERLSVKGIGTVGDIKTLPLEALFLHVGLKRSLEESDLRSSRGQEHISAESEPLTPTRTQGTTVDPMVAISESRKLVLLGGPGMGKSTLLQFIALRIASGDHRRDQETSRVPFFLRVRSFVNFDSLPTPKDFISLCARILDCSEAQAFVTTVLRQKRGVILIDGLDECELKLADDENNSTVLAERDKVVAWIEQMSSAFPGNSIVVSTRPVGYRRGELSEAGFATYEIPPLSTDQQMEFVGRWYQAVELSSSSEDGTIVLSRAREKSHDLTRRIRSSGAATVLAYNPLMLSVICILHRQRGESIPERKIDLLDDCLKVLLYDWRNAQGLKRSVIGDLNSKQLRALLAPLAWRMVMDGNEQVSEGFLKEMLAAHLPEIQQLPVRATEILDVIRDRTGVLVEVSSKTYSFMHLQFQEFLAAEECAQSRDSYDVLLSNAKNPRWKEIIPMAVAVSRGNQEMLIRGLLNAGHIALSASAVAMVERVSVDLRSDVVKGLSHHTAQLKKSFDYQELLALVEVGTVEAIQEVLRLLLNIPMLSTDEYLDFAAAWDFEEVKPAPIDEIAHKTAQRALLWKDFEIGKAWGSTRDMGYFSEDSDIGRGASWSCLNVGVRDRTPDLINEGSSRETTSGKPIDFDPVYNYAVLLDTCDSHRGAVSAVCWKAFMLLTSSVAMSPEHTLLALHFAWYYTNSEENISDLLQFLMAFSPEVCPAFQIGILNNAMSELCQESADRFRERAEALWRREFKVVEYKIRHLVETWKDHYVVAAGVEGKPVRAGEYGQYFSASITEYMSDKRPFTA